MSIKGTQFQGQAFDVNVNMQGAMSAQRDIQRIQGKDTKNYVGEVFNQAAGLAVKLNEAQKSVDASTAKQLYINTVTNGDYLSATDTGKAEIFENIMTQNLDKSDSFINSFKGYSAGAYASAYEGREKEVRVSKLNLGGSDYVAWKEEDTYDIEGNLIGTNRTRGLGAAEWVDYKYSQDSSISKVEWGQVALNEDYSMMYADVINATPDTIEDVTNNIVELKSGLQSNFLLNSKEKATVAANTAREAQLQTLIAGKRKQFKATAKRNIEIGNDSNNPNPLNKYSQPLNFGEYVTAYGEEAEVKMQKDVHNKVKYDAIRQKAATFEPTNVNNWIGEDVEVTKVYQAEVTETILGGLKSGASGEAIDTIISQGSVEQTRVSASAKQLLGDLSSDDTVDETLDTLLTLSKTNSSAFNIMYPDPETRVKILAVDAISRALDKTSAEAWNYINGEPTVARTGYSTNEKVTKSNILSDPKMSPTMRQDMNSMWATLEKYGVPFKDIKNTIEDYKDTDPYVLKFETDDRDVNAMLEENLMEQIPEGDKISHDPLTNTIVSYNALGFTTDIIDKDKFITANNSVKVMTEYHKKHYVQTFKDDTLDSLNKFFAGSLLKTPEERQGTDFTNSYKDKEPVYTEDPIHNIIEWLTTSHGPKGRQ